MGLYQPLFTVSVEHAYFADGLWKGLDFIASPETARMVGGGGLLVKPTANGIGVFFDEERAQAMRLYAQETAGALRFDFSVRARDRAFENYTFPDVRKNGWVLRFGNAGREAGAADGRIRLSRDEFASEADFDGFDAAAMGIAVIGSRRIQPDFAVSLDVAPAAGARDFYVRFGARKSFWKYHLLGNMNRGAAYIVDLDSRVEFEPCGEVVLPGNRPARVFRSTERVPVQERSACRFQLREPGQGNGKVLVKRLPVASESRLGSEVIDGRSEIVLESYVNF